MSFYNVDLETFCQLESEYVDLIYGEDQSKLVVRELRIEETIEPSQDLPVSIWRCTAKPENDQCYLYLFSFNCEEFEIIKSKLCRSNGLTKKLHIWKTKKKDILFLRAYGQEDLFKT